ncbi:MAG: hypothetical protein HY341_00085 [Candidatus Kerfeldbacteria bacterium]|nr:hypothetical protein [Candidatus Kerfeldbacteria bacterium]
MFHRRFVVRLLIALAMTGVTAADAQYQYKLDTAYQRERRHLGRTDLGDVGSLELRLYVDNPATHTRILGVEFAQYDNAVSAASGIVLPEKEFSFGAMFHATRRCALKVAVTQQTFLNDAPFATFGVYPSYQRQRGALELGFERDQQDATFSYAMGKVATGGIQALYGASLEQYVVEHATVEQYRQPHLGGGVQTTFAARQIHLIGTSSYNTDARRFTWTAGFSRYANLGDAGLNPALIVAYREKPESRYALAILAFWGDSIHKYASTGIHEAFFRGGLKRSRIIGARYFDTPGVGKSYDQQDFGRLTFAASLLTLDAGSTAQLVSNEVTGTLTAPGSVGPIVQPFVAVQWSEFSDLIYDPVQHRLDDPSQRLWKVKVGGKLRFAQRGDPRQMLGTTRMSIGLDSQGGSKLQVTSWF